ncbi:PspC domain-containing protein [Pontibacter sp. BT731]|uniref:PspC domain-containing protein n=1 Tax=Pontibacter coccineus TaxID=3063328 RepID=UPI0026E2A2FD|nr:PspC domain-containing protein [Pontibacter sp. BT731]MDO6391132.1 PspC domain-containing protein [Pontibacter sp. BT731]
MKRLQYFIESQAFGVCAMLGEKLGIASSSIRLSFIYISFFTLGSPVILYFIMAFWMNVSKHLRRERSTVWDL